MAVAERLFLRLLLSGLAITGLVLVPFPTGWEGGIMITGLSAVDQPGIIYTLNCKGYNGETGELVVNLLSECSTGGNRWTIDIDAKNDGRPSLFIETQQLRHTDAGGEPTPADKPAASLVVTRNRDTYYIDRHIFMFEFQVRTVAASVVKNCFSIEGCSFDHETSAFVPSFTSDILRGTLERSNNGQPFDGASLILFSINPWQGARIVPENTIRFDQWVGVMQATIFNGGADNSGNCVSQNFCGKVPNAPGSQDFPWAVQGLMAVGAQPNMFTLDTVAQPTTSIETVESRVKEFGTPPLDRRIPQQVLIELPFKLTAGAAMKRNFFGNYNGLAPIDVFAKYVVRVDTVIVTGWTPQLDYVDSNANGVLDTGEFAFIDKNQDNLWTLGTDEAVSGTPPAPPPPAVTITSIVKTTAADGTAITTITYSDGTSTVLREAPAPPPSPPQVGCPPLCPPTIQPPPDIFFPPCNFFDFECRLANWQKFPFDLGTGFALLLPIIAIIAVVLIATTFFGIALGRRRGR